MYGTLTFLDLAGAVALLLWGVHMVQSGVQRAFGSEFRRILSRGFGGRLQAFTTGLGVTAVLQTACAAVFRDPCRRAKPRPVKPSSVMAQVEGSGTTSTSI